MRAAVAAIVLTLIAAPACADEPWFVGEHARLNNPLKACNSFEDWARFEIMRYREFDSEAAVKFLDEHCPTVITGPVVIEQIAQPPADLGMPSVAVCLRRIGDPGRCLWVDSGWLLKK